MLRTEACGVTLLEEPKNASDRLFNTPETQTIHFCVVKLKEIIHVQCLKFDVY